MTTLSASYKTYALSALTLVYAINLLDRGFMFMLMQAIKEDLQLSDTQLGLVTGIAFALFYAAVGVPIARWADRGNRVTIASLAIGIWAVTAMLTSAVTNFAQLVCARILAGAGDAGLKPPIYSLLGDYYPGPAERTRALYVFETAVPLSGLVSFIGAGWINENYGWRAALLLAGIPGLIAAVLIKSTIKEPRLHARAAESAADTHPAGPSLLAVTQLLWRQRSCRHLTIAMVLIFLMGQGVVSWQAPFMIRIHGMNTAELGVWMGLIHTIGSLAGIVLGGVVLDRFVRRDRNQMRLAAAAVASGLPFYVVFLTVPQPHLALAILIPHSLVFTAFVPVTFVQLQRLVPDNMRATAMMVMLLFANLIGMGIGPQVVGILSDVFSPLYGDEALRYSMLTLSLLGGVAGAHLWQASRTIEHDLLAAELGRSS